MSTVDQSDRPDDDRSKIDILKAIRDHRKLILRVTAAAAAVAIVGGAMYLFWGQRTLVVVSQQFRPVFTTAASGRYPNGLRFASSDITSSEILDEAFDRNGIKVYCSRESFKGSFFVEERSPEFAFLEAEYQGRLADARIGAIERDRLQAEYQSKRAALQIEYRIVFVRPDACSSVPPTILTKVVSDVLTLWATNSEMRRGVLGLNIDVLTPHVLDIDLPDDANRLVRADLVRTGLRRLADNVEQIERIPGAQLIKLGETRVTFTEVRLKLDDLVHAGLDSLLISAGRAIGNDSVAWLEEAVASASREQKRAEGRAKAYLDALREYSGTPQPTPTRTDSRQSTTGSSDVQTLTPQIDRTFIDRIVELSAPNTAFRQEMTRQMVSASVEAVEQQASVSHYSHMSDAMKGGGARDMTPQEIDRRLDGVVAAGKALAKQLDDLYDEFSRVSIRPAAEMYETTGPVQTQVVRDFTTRTYLILVGLVVAASLVLTIVGALAWTRFIGDSKRLL